MSLADGQPGQHVQAFEKSQKERATTQREHGKDVLREADAWLAEIDDVLEGD